MEYQTLQIELLPEKIGIIRLNRPEKRNAISIQMRLDISSCLKKWKNSDEVNAVIFIGNGPAFSAGFDIKEFSLPGKMEEIYRTSSAYHRDIWYFPKPTIAAIDGAALGGAFDLTLLCDIRICSVDAVMGHPEIKMGAPTLYTPLQWIVGIGAARELCLTGSKINADEAYRIGLVNRVVDTNVLLESSIQMAKTILEAPIQTLQYTKNYIVGNTGKGFEESFTAEHDKPFEEALSK